MDFIVNGRHVRVTDPAKPLLIAACGTSCGSRARSWGATKAAAAPAWPW